MKTTKITLKVLKDAKTGKPIVLKVPNNKLKEFRAVGRAGRKAGKHLLKVFNEYPKTLTEFCGVDDAAFGRYLEREYRKLAEINKRADKRISNKDLT